MDKINEIIQQKLKNNIEWESYRQTTKKNIDDVEIKQHEAKQKCKTIDETISTIQTLSQDARRAGYIKLSPLCHIYATIKHTGEYNVHFNDNYKSVLTAKQTIDYLERKKKDIEFDLEIYENQVSQLTKRLNIEDLFAIPDEEMPAPNLEDMPEQITSDLGVAMKKGGFYEILEVDESSPYSKPNKRVSRIKT